MVFLEQVFFEPKEIVYFQFLEEYIHNFTLKQVDTQGNSSGRSAHLLR